MRTLKKHLEKIYRKVALQLVQRGHGTSTPASSSATASADAQTGSPAAQASEESPGAPSSTTVFFSQIVGA